MAFSQSNVSSYVVDLTRVTRTGTVAQDPVQDSQPLAQQLPLPSAPLRRIYERPGTACSKPQRWAWGLRGRWGAQEAGPSPGRLEEAQPGLTGHGLLSATPRVKQNSESERRSPSSEDDRDERESRAEIQNAEDYNEIFQPKNSISEAWLPPLRVHVPTCEMEAEEPFWGQHPCHSLSFILNSHQARLCSQAL